MVPVSGHWVDFAGLQKEPHHLSMSCNTHTHPIISIVLKMILNIQHTYCLHSLAMVKHAQTTQVLQKWTSIKYLSAFYFQIVFTFSSSHMQGRP